MAAISDFSSGCGEYYAEVETNLEELEINKELRSGTELGVTPVIVDGVQIALTILKGQKKRQ
jgi:hypothetical protein